MELRYTSPFERGPGMIDWLLNESYAALVEAEPELWESEKENWAETDRSVFENPISVGACTYLSWCGDEVAGFFSFDPRPWPDHGIIGHNCILPEYRGHGFGKEQIREALRLLKELGIRRARVSTNDHPFFVPAQRMYVGCGFREVKRVPWERDPGQNMIHYELELGEGAPE
ncbi:MAG: GNAT family N-acetyltransferase [bacterium]|nr:GNAT family N-acetyltransferase [bacterium]